MLVNMLQTAFGLFLFKNVMNFKVGIRRNHGSISLPCVSGLLSPWELIAVFIKQILCLYKFLELLMRREVKDKLMLHINYVLLFLQ